MILSDRYGVNITYYGNNNKFTCGVENGTLKITGTEKSSVTVLSFDFTPMTYKNTVKIYIPKNTKFKNLKVKDSAGRFVAAGFTAENTDIDIPYGDLKLSDADCGDTLIKTSSGKSSLKNITAKNIDYKNNYGYSSFENINISTESNVKIDAQNGAILLNKFTCGNLEVDNDYGSVNIDSLKAANLKSNMQNGKLAMKDSTIGNSEIQNSYGSIEISGLTSGGASVKCSNGSIWLSGALKGKTDVHSDYGSVNVETSIPKSKYSYNASSSYGSVSVDGEKAESGMYQSVGAENTLSATTKNGSVSVNFQK